MLDFKNNCRRVNIRWAHLLVMDLSVKKEAGFIPKKRPNKVDNNLTNIKHAIDTHAAKRELLSQEEQHATNN